MTETSARTPCVGICTTGLGDQVCRGCKRFTHEVVDWNRYSAAERQLVNKRLEQLLLPVIRNKVRIVNRSLFIAGLEQRKIRFDRLRNPYYWLLELMRSHAGLLAEPERLGLVVTDEWLDMGSEAIKAAIDREFYELSCAHYERYFPEIIASTAAQS